MDQQIIQIIQKLPDYFMPERSVGISMTTQLNLQNDTVDYWAIKIENLRCEVRHEKALHPQFELTASSADLLDILTGKLESSRAYMQGKVNLRGNILHATKLLELFDIPEEIKGKIRF